MSRAPNMGSTAMLPSIRAVMKMPCRLAMVPSHSWRSVEMAHERLGPLHQKGCQDVQDEEAHQDHDSNPHLAALGYLALLAGLFPAPWGLLAQFSPANSCRSKRILTAYCPPAVSNARRYVMSRPSYAKSLLMMVTIAARAAAMAAMPTVTLMGNPITNTLI